MRSPRKEAEMITEVLFDEYGSIGVIPPCLPPIQEGKEAVQWLKKKGIEYREDNWVELYFKFRTLELLENKKPGQFKHIIFHNNHFLVKGDYSWDIQTETLDSWDKRLLDKFLDKHGGMGVLLITTFSESNTSGESGADFIVLYITTYFLTKENIQGLKNESKISHNKGYLFTKNFNCDS